MAFGDFLTGVNTAYADDIGQRRERRRTQEDAGIAHKQDVGTLVLQGLVNGTVRPEFGSAVLGEMGRLQQPRKSAGGLEGFLGGTQQPETPSLDTLTSGGWGQAFLSPQELAARDFQMAIDKDDQMETASMRAKLKRLPEFKKHLMETMGIPEDMATAAAIKVMYGENVFGASGAAGEYWDPIAKKVFRGQRDPIRGVIDVTTNQPVEGARAAKIDYEDRWDTNERLMIDRYAPPGEQIIGRIPNATAGARPFQPWMSPQMGGAWDVSPGQSPVFRPGVLPDGTPAPTQAPAGGDVVNAEFDRMKFHLDQIQTQVKNMMARVVDLPEMAGAEMPQLQQRERQLMDEAAKGWGYGSYKELIDKISQVQTRVPRAPAAGAGVSRQTPAGGGAGTQPAAANGWKTDKSGVQFTISP